MANFNGTDADDTFTGTDAAETIVSGGGKDTLNGAGSDDRFVLDAKLAVGSVIDGGAGADTLVLRNLGDALVRRSLVYPEGIATSDHALYNSTSFASIERIQFDSNAGTLLSATFGFGTQAPALSQFVDGQISPTAALTGGLGYDELVMRAVVEGGATINAPVFTYTNWQTPARAYLPGDRVTIAMLSTRGGGTLNGSAHAGVQNLIGRTGDDTINGSGDMDFIRGGGGTDHLYGNAGDDTLAFTQTIIVNGNGETVGGREGFVAAGVIDGGTGFDFLAFGGYGVVAAEIRNIEGIYLAPAYSNDPVPGQVVPRQNLTAVNFSGATWAQVPSNLLLAGVGNIRVEVTPGGSFDGAGYKFDPGSDITFIIAFAMPGNDTDETIVGTSADDIIDTSDGDDTVTPGAGNDSVAGGGGRDVAVFSGIAADYTVTRARDATLTFLGPDGEDTLYRVEVFRFDDGDFMWKAEQGLIAASDPVIGAPFRLFLGEGFVGEVGGTGLVAGTNGVEDITIVGDVNDITFDASFNRGGDVIRLPGFANDYRGHRAGSLLVLTNDLSTYSIPVGGAGAYVTFDDDPADQTRLLQFNSEGKIQFGYQVFGDLFEIDVAFPLETVPLPQIPSSSSVSRMFVGIGGAVLLGGKYQVQGANGVEQVTWLHGDIELDGSFNRGGDMLAVGAEAEEIRAYLSGSRVVLEFDGGSASIPFGVEGMTIEFDGNVDGRDLRVLRFDSASGKVLIGEQIIDATTAATANALETWNGVLPVVVSVADANFASMG